MTYSQISCLRRSRYSSSHHSATQPKTRSQAQSLAEATTRPSPSYLIIALSLVFLLVVIYLFQVSTTNGYSYIINDLNQQETEIGQQVERMELENLKLKSNQNVHDFNAANSQLTLPTAEQIQVLD